MGRSKTAIRKKLNRLVNPVWVDAPFTADMLLPKQTPRSVSNNPAYVDATHEVNPAWVDAFDKEGIFFTTKPVNVGPPPKQNMTHPEIVAAVCKSGHAIAEEMTPESANLLHAGVGLSAEVGELLDAIKKCVFYHKRLDAENVVEELGDIEFFLQVLRSALNITREQTINGNILKMMKRYGDKYSDAAAIARADKV